MATTAGKNKQVKDAQSAKAANAKKKVAKEDPNFMPNIEPQIGDKAEKAEQAKGHKANGGVRLDPNLPLVVGNSVTFVADEGKGRVMVRLETAQGVNWVAASNGHGDARVSLIIQVKGDIKVDFHSDGKKYASGTFTV
jgi:hypothetical protein